MRVIRVRHQGKAFYAALLDNEVQPLDQRLESKEAIPLNEVSILPLVVPTKVVCVGLNYHAHAEELGKQVPSEPLLFLKPPSSVIGTGESIVYPGQSQNVHYEGELGVVIGRQCRQVSVAEAPEHVFGFCCGNDVTARDLQNADVQYTRAKGFDTFCPLGPWIETDFKAKTNLLIRTYLNGELRQEGRTSDMIVSPFELVSFVSGIMTLMPGDVLLTGTPPGVGSLRPGDEVKVEIEEVGVLMNSVADGRPS
jgi:2-keto-4-pentenoate hydratase/2-oxohepta-3-ene-1,7-dioic acid hydratase in catechol pathway